MGKGKGSVDFWAAKVKPGRVMFEIDGVDDDVAREASAPGRDEAADQDPHRGPRGLVKAEDAQATSMACKIVDFLRAMSFEVLAPRCESAAFCLGWARSFE